MTRGSAGAAVLVLVLVPPLLTSNPFLLHLAITVLLWTLLGAAWNLLGGFAGQVSFGHSTFFGVGGNLVDLKLLRDGRRDELVARARAFRDAGRAP